MVDLISEFWQWLSVSKEEYILNFEVDFEEYMFPLWNELLAEVKKDIRHEKQDLNSLDKVLTVMAFDNENEDIMDYIVENASDEYIDVLVQNGVYSLLHNARWQIAEILGRRKTQEWERLLDVLIKDSNPYVAKRAKNIHHRAVSEA